MTWPAAWTGPARPPTGPARPPTGPARPPTGPARPPLVRPTGGRRLAGVAGGVADHLGIPVKVVRIAFVVATLAGGPGLVLYVWLWALVPAERRAIGRPGPPVPPPVVPPAARAQGPLAAQAPVHVDDDADRPARFRARPDLLAGLFLVGAGVVLAGSQLGWGLQPNLTLPILIVAAGGVIAYAQIDEVDRARWFARTGVGTRAATLRLALGLVLVVLGILLLVVQQTDIVLLGQTLLAAIAVLVGVAVVLAPWGVRLWRDLDSERAARARESERADIAAHLHDSVLQTLALIQRRSGDGAEVARLARAQERDLRSWLYGGGTGDPSTVSARVALLAAEAEDLHGVVVEVVTVGDRQVDERTEPLLAALREAMANAARHAGGTIQVYVEFGPAGVEAYVRDRGPGFDLDVVGEDRLGVRESIIGRMERHGGRARVISTPGEGTEVRLSMPDEEVFQ